MSKDGMIELEGVVVKVLPSSLYKVQVQINNNNFELLCHPCGKMKVNSILLTTGDKVQIEVSPYDKTKGRIIYRLKS